MTERERLIKLLSSYFQIGDSYAYNLTRVKTAFDVGTMSLEDFEEFDEATVADIADYLLERGVIVPPCKAGDIIYAFTYDGKYYLPFKVTRRENLVRWMDEDQFGNALFTTREEAEAALAERRKS